ncbi:unnamed protein product [Gordionus sp. m RMFG-2023]|uniref:kelch-like protein 10 n=1 Tax=Gordionus sp. m RMFG-2023 TaxID=3053472 RepID=UPI0030E5789B
MEIASTSKYFSDSNTEEQSGNDLQSDKQLYNRRTKMTSNDINKHKKFKFHNTRMLQELRDMWINKQFCDTTIKVDKKTYLAHRIVLASKSEYFRGLFNTTYNQNQDKANSIYVIDISSNNLEKLLNFCYTGKFDINSQNVQETYVLADKYGFLSLLKFCINYLVNHLDIENCISVLHFAKQYNCKILEDAAQSFIWKNFQSISEKSSEFLILNPSSLTNLLKSEELNVRSEEKAFEAVVKWVDHDPLKRKNYILPLIQSIRLGLIDTNYFVEKVKSCKYIKDTPACRPLVRDTIKFLYDLRSISENRESRTSTTGSKLQKLGKFGKNRTKSSEEKKLRTINITDSEENINEKDYDSHNLGSIIGFAKDKVNIKSNSEIDLANALAKPRLPHEIMFVIGGWSGGSPTNIVETYDTRADRWVKCTHLEPKEPRAYHGLITLNNKIYMIGGFNGDEYFNTCKVLDPSLSTSIITDVNKDKWIEIAPMNSPRCYVSVAVLNGFIYAMGGFDGHARLNTTERYDPKCNQWSPLLPMNHQRSDASATTLDNKIYIAGGFNGQECMSSAEYYDPTCNVWVIIAYMKVRRSGVGVLSLNNKIYALGGFNGISRMSSVERYDPKTSQWEIVPDMNHPRSNFACEVIDDMIFVVGGFNGVSTIFHVECYNDIMNEWFEATDMNLYRSALSACVVSDLPNRNEFIHKNRSNLLEEKRQRMQQISVRL